MKKILVIFVALFICSEAAFWRACHIAKPLPTSVESNECTDAGCTITRGGFLTATIGFTPTAEHQTIETFIRVQPVAGGGWVDIPITTPNATNSCNFMVPNCPTTAGTPTTFSLNLQVPPQTELFSNANFEVYLAAIQPVPADVFCFQVTATVTAG